MDGKTFAKALALATRAATAQDSIFGGELAAHMETPQDVQRELAELVFTDLELRVATLRLGYGLAELAGAVKVVRAAAAVADAAGWAKLGDAADVLARDCLALRASATRIAAVRLRIAVRAAELRAKLAPPEEELVAVGDGLKALDRAVAGMGDFARWAGELLRERAAGQIKTLEQLFDRMVAS